MDSAAVKKYDLKELELNALLEITQAINNNLPEDSLYRIYQFTLLGNLRVKKLALFVLDDQWECKVAFGVDKNFREVQLDSKFHHLDATIPVQETSGEYAPFDTVFPVMHKDKLLAVVFIGDMEILEEDEEASTTFLVALTNIIMVAIENKKLARQQLAQEAYRKELEIAKEVQQFLFPKALPNTPSLEIQASYLPHHDVGGDYYDYIPLDNDRFIVCIADVSGKGVPAALWMSNFQASLRTLVRKTSKLEEIVGDLNYQILNNTNGELFITFFVALYNPNHRTLTYINAGHNPPLLIQENCEPVYLDAGSTVLGAFNPLPFINQGVFDDIGQFELFCYTDGLVETRNAEDEEFGMERVEAIVNQYACDGLEKVHGQLIAELNAFNGNTPYSDDITLLSCRVDLSNS